MTPLKLKIIAVIAAAGILVCGYFYVGNVKADRDRYKSERNQSRQDLKTCQETQKKDFEVSNDLLQKLSASDRKLANALRVRDNARCVLKVPSTSGVDTGAADGKLSGRNGISSDYLRDFATRCEKTRLTLKACQEWISQ